LLLCSMLLRQVVVNMDYTLLIPVSLDLVRAMGRGAMESGLLIGMGSVGVPIGVLLSTLAAKMCRDTPGIMRSMVAVDLVCMTASLACALMLVHEWVPVSSMFVPFLLLRTLASLSAGTGLCLVSQNSKATPMEEMTPWHSLPSNLGTSAGLLLGPVMIRLVPVEASVAGVPGIFRSTAALLCIMELPHLLLAALMLAVPDTKAAEEASAASSDECGLELIGKRTRSVVIGAVLTWTLLSGVMFSAVEVGTAMVLEDEFGWAVEAVGMGFLFISIMSMLCCLLIIACRALQLTTDVFWLLSTVVLCCLGTLLLYTFLGTSPVVIFLGDSVVYASAHNAWSLITSLGLQMVGPGDLMSSEVFNGFLFVAMVSGCVTGPPVARFLLSAFGRNTYAVVVSCSAVGMALLSATVCAIVPLHQGTKAERGAADALLCPETKKSTFNTFAMSHSSSRMEA